MRLKNLDLVVTMIIAAMNVVWTLLPIRPPIIGTILALPLVFVSSGYVLVAVLFPKPSSLTPSHRLLLSLGLSLVIDILGGFVLNMLPTGLHAMSWAVLLGLMIVIFSLLAIYLRRGLEWNGVKLPRFRFTGYQYLLLGLASVIFTASILYATVGAANQPYPGFTQLWMLPTVQTGKSCTVHLGMQSFETTSVTYRVTVIVQKTQAASWTAITLKPQQQWNQLVPIPLEVSADVHVAAQIYRLDQPGTVYRNVASTLYGCPTSRANGNNLIRRTT